MAEKLTIADLAKKLEALTRKVADLAKQLKRLLLFGIPEGEVSIIPFPNPDMVPRAVGTIKGFFKLPQVTGSTFDIEVTLTKFDDSPVWPLMGQSLTPVNNRWSFNPGMLAASTDFILTAKLIKTSGASTAELPYHKHHFTTTAF